MLPIERKKPLQFWVHTQVPTGNTLSALDKPMDKKPHVGYWIQHPLLHLAAPLLGRNMLDQEKVAFCVLAPTHLSCSRLRLNSSIWNIQWGFLDLHLSVVHPT